jgi:hypothetical protein
MTSVLPDYLNPPAGGRTFSDLATARSASLRPGDKVLLRDLATIAPSTAWSTEATRGKWRLRPYTLADGQTGRLLMVNDAAKEHGQEALPPEIVLTLDLPGWYALWIGVPQLDLRPILANLLDGVDVSLDGDPGFTHIQPERGTRKGKILGAHDTEIMCYWTCARLDSRTLRLRIPYGAFASQPWGLVRAVFSSLRLVKLSAEQVAAFQSDVTAPDHKRVIYFHDGFSPYWLGGVPGTGIDARYVEMLRHSDVKAIVLQTPATGVANWPSKVTCLVGEAVPEEKWQQLRLGDRRAYDYLRWSCANGQDGMTVMSRLCHENGMQFHAGLRMNLFFTNGPLGSAVEDNLNGVYWREHPELRKQAKAGGHNGLSGGPQWDYALPGARRFAIDILVELATDYDVDGISLDFTRWPPIADPQRHDCSVLTNFVSEIRRALDGVEHTKGRKIALSASVVDGYHAFCSLAEQKIDLEAWLAGGLLDFVGVQAWDMTPFVAMAARYNTPCYAIMDQESVDDPRGKRFDPGWQQETRKDEDPVPGEEMEDAPHVNSCLDASEYYRGALRHYRNGAAGIGVVNAWGSIARRLGHVEELALRTATDEIFGQIVGPAIKVA